MQHKSLTRFVSVFVLLVMVCSGIALTSRGAMAVTPQQVNDAVDKFTGAIGKFAAKDASANIGKIANFCSRLGGLTSAASGVIGILQMIGIIQDPTTQMLGQILDAVKDVQTQLSDMNKTLNQMTQELINIQVAQQEIARNNKATTMSTNWNNFNTNYTEKLQTYVNEYQAKINEGIEKWWKQASHEGVYVLLTENYLEGGQLTYSKQPYSAGLPKTSDIANDKINTYWSIGIPSNYMPNTSAVTFNVNTYRDDFKKIMIPALEKTHNDNQLASDCGEAFKYVYDEIDDDEHDRFLKNYADYVLNTVIYKISCEVMTANNDWVTDVLSTYTDYCNNILQLNSGINAFLNYIYQTHAFEGEVKDDITKFLDAMVAQVGFYGQFALTCAGQSNLQTTATKEQLRENFVNTVLSIDGKKSSALTGKDNYCYITGTVLEADTTSIGAVLYMHASGYEYTGCDNRSWSINIPSIVTSVYMPIIYKQYTQFPQGAKSFGEYLHKHGVQNDSGNKTYLTQFHGTEDFSFSEGIYMIARRCISGGDHFSDGNWYHIDVGTGSDVKQNCYHAHNKAVGDWFNSSNGNLTANATIAARAAYGESHWYWKHDEEWVFSSEGFDMSVGAGYHDDKYVSYHRSVDIVKSTAYHNLSGSAVSADNPFFAFERVSLTPGVSDNTDMHYFATASKDITEVLLDSDSFVYNGQPVEPAVTVFCSDDVVSEDNYVVTYWNNTAAGDYAYVKVEGIGEYTGDITRRFIITSSDASSYSDEIVSLGSSSSGCNAMGGLCAAFGLAFVMRKFRRR